MVVLVWQAAEGRLGQQKLWWLHSRCAEARGCIGRTFAYIDTQIPLAYIHLLALLVKITLLVMTIEAGVALGLWLEQQQRVENADNESWHSMEADEQRVSFSVSSTAWFFLRGDKLRSSKSSCDGYGMAPEYAPTSLFRPFSLRFSS